MSTYSHKPVMLSESIAALNLSHDGIYIDATFGRGGHTQEILQNLSENGKVIAIDRDIAAIEYGKQHIQDNRLELIHGSFADIGDILQQRNLMGKINGILMDLGVSSPQLDNASRGFSFNRDGELDMRMNQTTGISAKDWIAEANEVEIADVLYQYGEEKRSRKIAKAIKIYQQDKVIATTLELANIISAVIHTHKNKHPATRSFQAIRIFINQELIQLSSALEQTIDLLAVGGRVAILSFHSLEDRIVKQFINVNSRPKYTPSKLPIMDNDMNSVKLKRLAKKFATKDELRVNKRARSAILRTAQKC